MLVSRSVWRGSSLAASRLANSLVRLDKSNRRQSVADDNEQALEELQFAWSAQSERISQQLQIIDQQLTRFDSHWEPPSHLAVYQSERSA